MKKNFESLYETLGGTYREENGRLIPDIALPEQTNYQIGEYGRMHLDYIKQHRRGLRLPSSSMPLSLVCKLLLKH